MGALQASILVSGRCELEGVLIIGAGGIGLNAAIAAKAARASCT